MKLQCKLCGKNLHSNEMLSAPNPFDADDILKACPDCKQITDGFDHICDIDGCKNFAGCGFPVPKKYKSLFPQDYLYTCHKHWKQYEK